MKDVKFEIVERIGTIREGSYPVRLCRISWNDGKPKFDLRSWKIAEDDTEHTPERNSVVYGRITDTEGYLERDGGAERRIIQKERAMELNFMQTGFLS